MSFRLILCLLFCLALSSVSCKRRNSRTGSIPSSSSSSTVAEPSDTEIILSPDGAGEDAGEEHPVISTLTMRQFEAQLREAGFGFEVNAEAVNREGEDALLAAAQQNFGTIHALAERTGANCTSKRYLCKIFLSNFTEVRADLFQGRPRITISLKAFAPTIGETPMTNRRVFRSFTLADALARATTMPSLFKAMPGALDEEFPFGRIADAKVLGQIGATQQAVVATRYFVLDIHARSTTETAYRIDARTVTEQTLGDVQHYINRDFAWFQ